MSRESRVVELGHECGEICRNTELRLGPLRGLHKTIFPTAVAPSPPKILNKSPCLGIGKQAGIPERGFGEKPERHASLQQKGEAGEIQAEDAQAVSRDQAHWVRGAW